jgi:Zn-dependent peptidase ImmA (M78 family)/transcriptional regulator with XRE-family HTH domain
VSELSARSTALIFDPLRLRIARQAAMLTKKDLSERVSVSAGALSQYEKGTTIPSAAVIAELALALGTPVEFFASDRPLGAAPQTVAHFRSLRSTTQRERDRAFAHALLTWEVAKTLTRFVHLPAVDLPSELAVRPDDPIEVAASAARSARDYWALGSGPIPNVVRHLESKGVVCTRSPEQTRRVYAFSCAFPERPVVVLSSERDTRALGRFDAAHELGHLLIHEDEGPGTHAVERQAHAFAAEFVAPAEHMHDELPARADWRRFIELKQVWGLSIGALLFRARELGVMPENAYRRAVTEMNDRGWTRNEPGDNRSAERPVLLAKSLDLCAANGVSAETIRTQSRVAPTTFDLIVGRDDRPSVVL